MVHFCRRGNRCDIDISLLACNFRNLLDDTGIILGRMHNIVSKLTKLTICKTHMSTAQNLTSRVHFRSPGNRCDHSFFLSACNFWHTLHYRGIISGHMQNIIPKLSKLPVCKTHIPLLKTQFIGCIFAHLETGAVTVSSCLSTTFGIHCIVKL